VLRRQRADAGDVRCAPVDGSEVELPVAGVQHDALGCVQGDGERVGNGVRYGNELDVEWADLHPVAVGVHHPEIGAVRQARFVDAVARKTERERRAVERELEVTQEEVERADVVLVAMRQHACLDAVRVLAQESEIGQHEVDTRHVDVGEHETAVDDEQPLLDFDDRAVAPDLPQPA
jgi:hypothetical protein